MQCENDTPDKPAYGQRIQSSGFGVVRLHQDAEILAKRKLDETERDGVRSNKIAYVKDTGSPAKLLTLEVLCRVSWIRCLHGERRAYQVFSQPQDGAVCKTGFCKLLELILHGEYRKTHCQDTEGHS